MSLSAGGKKGNGTINVDTQLKGFGVVLNSGAGTIGSLGNPVEIDAQNLVAIAGKGGVFIDSKGTAALNLNDIQSAGVVNVAGAGKVNINTTFGAQNNLAVVTTGDIVLNSNIGSTKTSADVLLDSSNGSIIQTSSKTKISSTTGAVIAMNAQNGNIGLGSPIRVDAAGLIQVNNVVGTGSVSIDSLTKGTVTLNIDGAGDAVFTSAGATDLSDVRGKSISITNAGGSLQLLAGRQINSLDGGIVLNNLGKGKATSIVLNKNSVVSSLAKVAGAGEIDLVIGTMPPPQVKGAAPVGVTTSEIGGTIFFNDGITLASGAATVNTKNTNVIFSAGKAGPTAIVLNDGVLIDADPPMPAPSPALVTVDTAGGGKERAAMNLVGATALNAAQVIDESDAFSSFNNISTYPAMPVGLSTVLPNQMNFVPGEEGALRAPLHTVSNTRSTNAADTVSNTRSTNDTLLNANSVSSTGAYTIASRPGWISETELEFGAIPGSLQIFDDTNCGANLSNGSMLVAPAKDVSISTPFGDVNIAAKSLVLVMAFRDGVAVYNFDDVSRESVNITSGGRKLTLAPSQSAVVTHDSIETLAEINPAQAIAHRSVNERKFGNGIKAFHSEFSIPSALAAVLPIKELMNSKHPHAVKTSRHLLKTTSILLQLQSGGSGFSRHVKPQRTCLTARAI